jgi:2-oxoglutarate ferredoxin oxidoreductase subunit beta
MHDGSVLRFTRLPEDYDVADREKAFAYLKAHPGEVVTGILFADESVPDLHEMNRTPATALTNLPWEKLCPGATELQQLQNEFR